MRVNAWKMQTVIVPICKNKKGDTSDAGK